MRAKLAVVVAAALLGLSSVASAASVADCVALPGALAEARCLTPLAERGDAQAQVLLGDLYADPDKQVADGRAALAWYLRAEAAAPGAGLETKIAGLYGPPPADAGPVRAGSVARGGLPVNYTTAMSWLRRAAHRCDADDQAQLEIADFYAYGAGVATDRVQALTWYWIASHLGATASSGGEFAEDLSQQMTAAEIHQARQRARDYLAERKRRCGG